MLTNQPPQVLLCRADLNPLPAQPVFMFEIAPTQVQDLALGLVCLHEVHTGPPLQPVEVPLDGIPHLKHVDCTTHLGVVGKLDEDALSPTVPVIDKDVNHRWSQYQPLRNVTCHWSARGHRAIGHISWSVTIQPILIHPVVHPSKSCLSNLETRMSCGTVSNALLKSG